MDSWSNCYGGRGWGRELTPAAFSHPAKVSFKLAERIYRHALAEVWLAPGMTVLDPFGGIAGFGYHALQLGLNWVGVELESDFIELGQESYGCPGFDSYFWRRYQGREAYIGLLRETRALCPECKSALTPKSKRDKRTGRIVKREVPAVQPHVYRGNLPLWEYRYGNGHFQNFGTARLVQGDSRRLREVLGGASGLVSSPPYSGGDGRVGNLGNYQSPARLPENAGDLFKASGGDHRDYGSTPGQLGALPAGDVEARAYGDAAANLANMAEGRAPIVITSPVYLDARQDTTVPPGAQNIRYGTSPAQLANLPEGSVEAVISSPPYVSGGHHPDQTGAWGGQAQSNPRELAGYGKSDGKLGQMAEGSVEAVVSSPPYEENTTQTSGAQGKGWYSGQDLTQGMNRLKNDYSAMASMGEGETFWSAAAQIVSECHALLHPGAHAIFVLKPFVRNKQIVDFPGQWQRLCESLGFRTLHVHVCPQTRNAGVKQLGLDGDDVDLSTWYASFFRRLHASKYPHLKIDFECVLCMERI